MNQSSQAYADARAWKNLNQRRLWIWLGLILVGAPPMWALELVTVSAKIIEPLIALSIIVVAVDNLVRPDKATDRYWLAGGFGLIHGFGFASVLHETGLAAAGPSPVLPLFAFNLGVELGQLAVAAVFVPLWFALRRWPAFLCYGPPAVSVLVITLSGYGFLQRTLW